MPEDSSLYDLVKDLSLVAWVVLTLVLVAAVYLLFRVIDSLVSRKCPSCAERVHKKALVCRACNRDIATSNFVNSKIESEKRTELYK